MVLSYIAGIVIPECSVFCLGIYIHDTLICLNFAAMTSLKVLLCIVFVGISTSSYGQLCAYQNIEYKHQIFIDPNNRNSSNNKLCYTSGEQQPCVDINFALAFPNRSQSTAFFLSSSATHKLNNSKATTVFDGALSVAFYGDNGAAVVECMDGAGLAFVNTHQISFNGVSFRNCGAWRNSTNKDFSLETFTLIQIRVALYFYNCRDVTMVNMSVLNSTEAVGVVMYSTAGMNNISHSQFDSNRISESNKNESGGGGFAVEFNYCKPGDDSCNETNYQTENNHNAVYIFEHCSFSNNRAIDQSGQNQTDISILPHNKTHFLLGRGGGLSLWFKGKATNITITINNCYFTKNFATWGAGMIVEYVDSAIQTVVNVVQSHFIENECYYEEASKGGPGGGVRVATFVYFPSNESVDAKYKRNSILFTECEFTANKALFGGAMSISFHLQPYSNSDQLFQARVVNTFFQSNLARLGSAVSVDRDHYFTTGELGEAFFDGCTFVNNAIAYVDPALQYSVGIGALYISEISVTFSGSLYFTENNGTALAIVGTTITLSDNVQLAFENNLGSKGGAISLLGISNMIIGRNTSLKFENNSASLYGGAIFNNYIGKEDLRSSIKCFIRYIDPFARRENWQTVFYFKGNKASKLGNSIFSTTILPCAWSEDIHKDHDIVSDIFCWNNSIWVYENSHCKDEINTFPRSFILPNTSIREIFPGQQFQLLIQARDDLEHDVSDDTIYTAATGNTSTCKVDPKYTYITDDNVSITGEEEQNVILELNTANTRDWHLQFDLTMERCPPGFKLNNVRNHAERICDCLGEDELYTFRGNLLCDKTNLVSKITNGYWIGVVPAIDNHTLYMGTTSLLHRYTNGNDTFPIARKYDELDADQCGHLNRKGPLCGECIEGYSTAVNSYNYKCVPCTSNTTYLAANIAAYIGLTYGPYLIVFIVIICCNVKLMSGPLVGFILYAQLIGSGVVDLTTDSQLPYNVTGDPDFFHNMQRAYKIVYGVFNLNSLSELMDPFCVHENFTALDVICLDYAVAVFPLLLILLSHVLIKVRSSLRLRCWKNGVKNVTAANRSPRSVVHAFTGFMYLSYAKFTLSSTKTLSTTGLFGQDGSAVSGISLIYYAGQYYFGQREYILPYGLLAIVVFMIVAVVLPILLLGPFDLMNWLTDKPKFNSLNKYWPTLKINIFLDAFRGCYRPECWYMSGTYFLLRLTVFIIYAFSTNEVTTRVWQLVFLILLTLLVAASQPYQIKALNYLDVAIFLNLILINLISVYLLYTIHTSNIQNASVEIFALGLILIWLPMVYFLLYLLIYLLWSFLRNRQRFYKTAQSLTHQIRCLFEFFKRKLIRSAEERQPLLGARVIGNMSRYGLTDSGLFNRAQEPNRSKHRPPQVTHTTVDLNDETDATVADTNTAPSSEIAVRSSPMSNAGGSASSNMYVQETKFN